MAKNSGKKAFAIGAAVAAAASAVAAGIMFWRKNKKASEGNGDGEVYFESFSSEEETAGEAKEASDAEGETGLNDEIQGALDDQTLPENELPVEETSPEENERLLNELKEHKDLEDSIKKALTSDDE